jgi:hypothetical protein
MKRQLEDTKDDSSAKCAKMDIDTMDMTAIMGDGDDAEPEAVRECDNFVIQVNEGSSLSAAIQNAMCFNKSVHCNIICQLQSYEKKMYLSLDIYHETCPRVECKIECNAMQAGGTEDDVVYSVKPLEQHADKWTNISVKFQISSQDLLNVWSPMKNNPVLIKFGDKKLTMLVDDNSNGVWNEIIVETQDVDPIDPLPVFYYNYRVLVNFKKANDFFNQIAKSSADMVMLLLYQSGDEYFLKFQQECGDSSHAASKINACLRVKSNMVKPESSQIGVPVESMTEEKLNTRNSAKKACVEANLVYLQMFSKDIFASLNKINNQSIVMELGVGKPLSIYVDMGNMDIKYAIIPRLLGAIYRDDKFQLNRAVMCHTKDPTRRSIPMEELEKIL